jgi:hypothetical protein
MNLKTPPQGQMPTDMREAVEGSIDLSKRNVRGTWEQVLRGARSISRWSEGERPPSGAPAEPAEAACKA